MILVFGGTTEGKKVIEALNTLCLSFIYSTKTEVSIDVGAHGQYRYGILDDNLLSALIDDKKIECIVNAAHPFATELHDTISRVVEKFIIPTIRFSRLDSNFGTHSLLQLVDGYGEATEIWKKINPCRTLALTGVQSIPKFKTLWTKVDFWFRILDRPSSIEMARMFDFPENQLLLGFPSQTLAEEKQVYRDGHFDCIITKDSGRSGLLPLKIDAAIQLNIPIIILRRPIVSNYNNTVYSTKQLIKLLNRRILV